MITPQVHPHLYDKAPRIGLVLAGGGAKGAYQVGVVEYLAERRIPVAAIAGASIGSLNAGIVAAAADLQAGAAALRAVWRDVGSAFEGTTVRAAATSINTAAQFVRLLRNAANPVLQPQFLERLLRGNVPLDGLRGGTPLWVSVFPAVDLPPDIQELGWLLDVVLEKAGRKARWLHVNSLPDEQAIGALRASAALPVVSSSQEVGGARYRDGGIGDNTPITPLLDHERCDLFIVTHLEPGVLWDAHAYAPGQILEIRPSATLRDGGLLSAPLALTDFSPARMERLRAQGYEDAKRILQRAGRVFGAARGVRPSREDMAHAVDALNGDAGEDTDHDD